ncbi:MAG: hypothetical protein BGO98_15025 [Myxococcales bacterium 68-20]|nr:MAG: hypothetical protein BGO98_15025 [Myxococcales bacterium 68-20]
MTGLTVTIVPSRSERVTRQPGAPSNAGSGDEPDEESDGSAGESTDTAGYPSSRGRVYPVADRSILESSLRQEDTNDDDPR